MAENNAAENVSPEVLEEIAANEADAARTLNQKPSSVNDLFSLGFKKPEAVAGVYAENYDEAWLLEKHRGDKIETLYNRADADQRKDILFLAAFDEESRQSGAYPQTATANLSSIEEGKDGRFRLIMKNLGGTGLNFTVENNGRSIVFAKDQQFTAAQVKELSRFFYMHGIGAQGLEDFVLPEKISEVDVYNQATGEKEKFSTVFSRELSGVSREYANAGPELVSADGRNETPDASAAENNSFGAGSTSRSGDQPKLKLSYKEAKGAIVARMNIMNFTSSLITTRRCADGSMVICAYNNEIDLKHDSETKGGDVKRTKAFAVKFNIIDGVPVVRPYMPAGKPMEAKHAQCMLAALKSQGCTHFHLPDGGATAYSGAGMGAIWAACGKTLMVPIVNPPKIEFSADNINDMLKTINDEGKQDQKKLDQWKADLIEQLHDQEDMAAYMKAHNTKTKPSYEELDAWVAQNGHAPARNSKIGDIIAKLEGDLKYTKLQDFTNGLFKQHVFQQSKNLDENGREKPDGEKWDAVQYMAAAYAYSEMLQHYEQNKSPDLSALLPDRPEELIKFFDQRANDPEVKKKIAREIQENIANGMREADALRNVREGAKTQIEFAITNIQTKYADFKPYDRFPYNLGTYRQDKYFEAKIDENGRPVTDRGKPVYDPEKPKPLSGSRQPHQPSLSQVAQAVHQSQMMTR